MAVLLWLTLTLLGALALATLTGQVNEVQYAAVHDLPVRLPRRDSELEDGV